MRGAHDDERVRTPEGRLLMASQEPPATGDDAVAAIEAAYRSHVERLRARAAELLGDLEREGSTIVSPPAPASTPETTPSPEQPPIAGDPAIAQRSPADRQTGPLVDFEIPDEAAQLGDLGDMDLGGEAF
jgi:hypothetical protein